MPGILRYYFSFSLPELLQKSLAESQALFLTLSSRGREMMVWKSGKVEGWKSGKVEEWKSETMAVATLFFFIIFHLI
jgi:hypothetical protein